MMLEVRDLHAYYGKSHILQGVDIKIDAGEVVSLLGRNGVGRSTTVKAIMGEVPPQGTILFKGGNIAGLPSYKIAHLGSATFPSTATSFPVSRCGRT
jgi:branched-chain amino acid transport system ATP-binding protein